MEGRDGKAEIRPRLYNTTLIFDGFDFCGILSAVGQTGGNSGSHKFSQKKAKTKLTHFGGQSIWMQSTTKWRPLQSSKINMYELLKHVSDVIYPWSGKEDKKCLILSS